MRPEVRDTLRELLLSSAQPGSDYATERGFARLLGLPQSKELDYADAVFRRVGVSGFAAALLRMLLALPLLPLAIPIFAISRDPLVREIRACLHDPAYLPRAQRVWALTRLPPHIRIDLEGSSFTSIHSEEMARSMLRLAHQRDLVALHVLVGLAHADEIAYFLERLPATSNGKR